MPRASAVDRVQEVYATSYRRLVGQLTGVTGDPVEAEDAVMEAFARAVNSVAVLPRGRQPRGLAAHRRGQRHPHPLAARPLLPRRQPPPGRRRAQRPSYADLPEDRLALLAALRRLPAAQREAIALHHLADLPVHEVAEAVGAPVGTVKARLARGRAALAELLSEETEPDERRAATDATTGGAPMNLPTDLHHEVADRGRAARLRCRPRPRPRRPAPPSYDDRGRPRGRVRRRRAGAWGSAWRRRRTARSRSPARPLPTELTARSTDDGCRTTSATCSATTGSSPGRSSAPAAGSRRCCGAAATPSLPVRLVVAARRRRREAARSRATPRRSRRCPAAGSSGRRGHVPGCPPTASRSRSSTPGPATRRRRWPATPW